MEVANALHKWADKELQFMPSGRYLGLPSPTPEDFSRLCRGQMIDIWNYMIKHVRSSSTVYKIRQNLKLQEMHSVAMPSTSRKDPKLEEIETLKAEKARCQMKLKSSLVKLEQADKDLQQTQKKLFTADTTFRTEKAQLDSVKKKTALLQLYTQISADKNKTLQQYAKYLESVDASFSGQGNSSGLQWSMKEQSENLCQLHLENVCCNYSSLFFDTMAYERDGDALIQNQQKLIEMSTKLSSTFSAVELFTALNKIVESAVDQISLAMVQSNRQKELEALKFRYSSGELLDVSNPPEITQTVANVLQEVSANHVKTFLNTVRAKNGTIKTQKLVEEAKADLCILLQSTICDQDLIEQIKANLELQLEITACNAALECLQKSGKELCTKLQENSNMCHKLKKQTEQIKNFERNKATMLQNIQKCITLNVSVHGQLNRLNVQITNYIRQNLLGKEQDLMSAIEPLWNHMEEELELMKTVPIHSLQATCIESGTVLQVQSLSIYVPVALSSNSSEQPRLAQIYNVLDIPVYQSPDALILLALAKKIENTWLMTFFKEILDIDQNIFCTNGGKKFTISELEELTAAVAENNQMHVEVTLPLVKTTLLEIKQDLELCVDIRTQMNEWWEQPAQHVPCSITICGRTFQDWKIMWKKNCQTNL